MSSNHPIVGRQAYKDVHTIMESGEMSGFRGYGMFHYGGKYVQKLEEAFKEYFNVKFAVSFNSATAALHGACIATNAGDALVSCYSFVSSASCVSMAGGTPAFVDVMKQTFNMNPMDAAAANAKAKKRGYSPRAVIPVHLCGNPCDMELINYGAKVNNMKVIEDCAQAIGAKYQGKYVGTIGDCGIFSFNQSKTVSSGEGGMLITNNAHIADIAQCVRNHGEVSRPDMKILGYNYRMCEIEAAIALEQFKRVDEMNAHRIELCDYVTDQLKDVDGLTPPKVEKGNRHTYYTYGVKVDSDILGVSKWTLLERLKTKGVYFGGYVEPLHLLPFFDNHEVMPVADRLYKDWLIVTDCFRPPMKMSEAKTIVKKIKAAVHG